LRFIQEHALNAASRQRLAFDVTISNSKRSISSRNLAAKFG